MATNSFAGILKKCRSISGDRERLECLLDGKYRLEQRLADLGGPLDAPPRRGTGRLSRMPGDATYDPDFDRASLTRELRKIDLEIRRLEELKELRRADDSLPRIPWKGSQPALYHLLLELQKASYIDAAPSLPDFIVDHFCDKNGETFQKENIRKLIGLVDRGLKSVSQKDNKNLGRALDAARRTQP